MSGNNLTNMIRLQEKYQKKVLSQLQKDLGIKNKMAVPKILKIVVNVGIGDLAKDKQAREKAVQTLTSITGQHPALQQARIAVADFKTRKGDVVGLKVTLRGKRMYQFLDKLTSIVIPRVRDFGGLSKKSFDQKGNYTLGLKEQIIFPEVDYDKIDKIRGLEITIVTSAGNKKAALRLLELMGLPFEK